MVKENHENDHDLFYSYFWMTTERSDHILVSSGPKCCQLKSLYQFTASTTLCHAFSFRTVLLYFWSVVFHNAGNFQTS